MTILKDLSVLTASGNLATIAQVQKAHTTNTTTPVTISSGWNAPVSGHLLVAFAMSNANNDITMSGWTGTNLNFASAPICCVAMFYKISDGTETAPSAAGTGASQMVLHAFEYSGGLSPVTFDAGPLTSTNTSAMTHTMASITTTETADLYIGGIAANNTMTAPGFTSGLNNQMNDPRLFTGDLIPGTTETGLQPVGTWTTNNRVGGGLIAAFKAARDNTTAFTITADATYPGGYQAALSTADGVGGSPISWFSFNPPFAGQIFGGDVLQILNTGSNAPVGVDSRRQASPIFFPHTSITAGMRLYSGTGAPSSTTVDGWSYPGDKYIRVDGGGGTYVYECTVAGTPGTWEAVF